jgi:uncharacterized protein (TIGR02145 family)
MKRIAITLSGLALSIGILFAQNDTMYIMKSGMITGKYNTADVDSVIFYNPMAAENTISDYDGNVYKTANIGTQTWMAENLRTTHYSDGSPIPKVSDTPGWDALLDTDPAYSWYNDDSLRNSGIYGALYTWEATMNGEASSNSVPSGVQGVCPSGWHVPSLEEWAILQSYLILNGYNYDGTALGNKIGKSVAATSHWRTSLEEGSVGNTDYPAYRNKSGFSALPGGYRDQWGASLYLENETYWWTSTDMDGSAWLRSLYFFSTSFMVLPALCYYKENGVSVRCLED